MTYFTLFFTIVFIPYLYLYSYQKGNIKYQKYEWNQWNEIGFYSALAFFIFVVLAPSLFTEFYNEFNDIDWERKDRRPGRRRGIPFEFVYSILWLVSLTMVTFPHIYKRASMPILPTGTDLRNEYSTFTFRLIDITLLSLSVVLTVATCIST